MVLLVQLRVTPPESVLELPELPKPKPQPAGRFGSTSELMTGFGVVAFSIWRSNE
ncbi:MAG TPA: hypothetical protein VMO52_07675 [Acidimicrobiia bacterium]|nr:hypothetical protein [Acidimicrobiia bacterium]